MSEPVIFGLKLSEAFFYFMVYSCLGWALETTYCSFVEKKIASRGFLFGPICPIYGAGALMMVCWFQPFVDRPVLFYLVATVCMSAWEYLVGWFLETTTHIKYWDYSMFRFNLNGRICLWVCLMWGVLSFVVLYLVQPWIEGLYTSLAGNLLYFLDGVLFGALVFDMVATVRQLVVTSQMLMKLQQAGEELRRYVEQSRDGLADRLEEAKTSLLDHLPEPLDEAGRAAKARYDELMASTEVITRRFRAAFHTMHSSGAVSDALESVKRRGEKAARILKGAVLKDPDQERKEK